MELTYKGPSDPTNASRPPSLIIQAMSNTCFSDVRRERVASSITCVIDLSHAAMIYIYTHCALLRIRNTTIIQIDDCWIGETTNCTLHFTQTLI